MSMLSAQCDELRDKAKLLRGHVDGLKAPYVIPSTKELMMLTMLDSATRMEEAADTILSLRDRLQDAELGSEPPYDELLRCLENDWHIHASWDGLRKFWCIELTEEGVKLRDAARAERTCEIESSYLNDFTVKNMCWYEFEMKCGYRFTWDVMQPPKFCPNCGRRVVER